MNINISKRLAMTACAAICCLSVFAQGQTKVTGKVVDKSGAPLVGASIIVDGTATGTVADVDGNYSINVPAGKSITVSFLGYKSQDVVPADGNTVYDVTLLKEESESAFVNQTIEVGAFGSFARSESTAAVSVISGEQVNSRTAKNLSNALLGSANGLVALDGAGTYFEKEPTFYVRGLQSLQHSTPLIIVDGVERDITTVAPSDVLDVQILKDAAAVALFGYKGVNNVIFVRTKRGVPESASIKVGYQHAVNFMIDRPEFVDAATYAKARNEALIYEGGTPKYSDDEIAAFESGKYANLYPNVNWVDETFKDVSSTNYYNLEFVGGGKRFKYFTALNLLSDNGFVKNSDENYGYSTQDMYSRGNLRSNLDIKLTDYTDLQVNISAILSEMSRPGNQANLWDLVYKTPSLAFPVKTASGKWGGSSDWVGSNNPAANAMGAAYYKIHERSLNADVIINQSLETFVEGLKVHGRLTYDNFSSLYEDHSKSFTYERFTSIKWNEGVPSGVDLTVEGTDSEMATGANTSSYRRRANLVAGFSFDRQLTDAQKLFAQIRYDYDFSDTNTSNTIYHRQNFTWYSHYGVLDKYFLDIALDASESNRLAPDHKWAFAPTFSAAWVLSNEDFLSSSDVFDFLKLRASWGKINSDELPSGSWTYFTQSYSSSSAYYPVGPKYDQGGSGSSMSYGRAATPDPTTEKAFKFNVGLDGRVLNCLDFELDFFRQHNKDAWVDGAGAYSAVIGFGAPYINQGETKSWGFEAGLDFNKAFGDLLVNVGGSFNFNRNEIIDMAEEPRAFDNLVRTGDPLNSNYGLKAIGLFKDQAEIDAAPKQTFTTVRPGDIRYEDVNDDKVIDENDVCKIGYSSYAPEIVYNLRLGLEFKGFGIKALFQGVGNYTANLNAVGYYWGLYSNGNLSKDVYDGRWTPENLDAEFPRLCSAANTNNFRSSTFWQRDRSHMKLRNAEVYYDFKNILADKKVVHGAKLFVRGVDLFTIDHIENADAASYGVAAPLTRSVIGGVSITF